MATTNKERKAKQYRLNRPQVLAHNRGYRTRQLRRARRLISFVTRHGCQRCPEKRKACLQFHHRDPATKSFTVGYQKSDRSLATTWAEIQKCGVICANCHWCLHAEERENRV